MRYDDPHNADRTQWHQLNIRFGDRHAAERAAIAYLGPVLREAESTGLVTSWFFIRKQWWRFRYLPASSTSAGEAKNLLEEAVRSLRDCGCVSRWVESIYEPETNAFGGKEGMAAAHDLFHADSCHILAHLGGPADAMTTGALDGRSKRRELSVLLCAALMRAAGQDRYEQGDIWAKVVDHRPTEHSAQPARWCTFTAAMNRLITVDTGPETALRNGALEYAGNWLTAFEHAGQTLRTLSDEGLLTRGIRAVTAHHIIFHWNRLGLPYQAQADMALAAQEVIFTRPAGVCR